MNVYEEAKDTNYTLINGVCTLTNKKQLVARLHALVQRESLKLRRYKESVLLLE